MKAHCKTCPFRPDKERPNQFADMKLASKVIERTLFQSQQICHTTESKNRKANNRCRGAFNYCNEIYERMGLIGFIKE